MTILIEKEYFYVSSKVTDSTDYCRQHLSSVADVYTLLKDSFKDILQELMEAECFHSFFFGREHLDHNRTYVSCGFPACQIQLRWYWKIHCHSDGGAGGGESAGAAGALAGAQAQAAEDDLNGNRTGKTGERLGADGKRQEMDTAYSYDLLNRMTEERRGQEGERYAYDPAGNRLRKQSCHYALTAAENRGSHPAGKAAGISYINGPVINPADDCVIDGEETYCYNERNQLTERRNRSVITKYLYDENGSLVREKEGEKTASCRYDLLNRQSYIKTPDGKEQENSYDGEGLRAGVRENGKASTFLFLNGEILAECDGDSMPIRRHLSGLGLSHVQTLDDGVYHTYHQDEQGSTAYVTGNEGTVENSYIYDAFGKVLESRENIKNRILYTGQQYDPETGQYYLRARYYNPVIGRFTQEDTYRGDGLNLYAYCGNNPVMYYDPSGYNMKDYSTQPAAEPEKPKTAGEGGGDTVAYHSVGGDNSAKKIQSVLDGIDISYTSPESRFGQGFYVAADGNTTVAELAYHGTDANGLVC